jgi:hypothetical protein
MVKIGRAPLRKVAKLLKVNYSTAKMMVKNRKAQPPEGGLG